MSTTPFTPDASMTGTPKDSAPSRGVKRRGGIMGKKRINSRQKGARGERQAAKYLASLGFAGAARTVQCNGKLPNSRSDVVASDSLPDVHIEVKYLVGGMGFGTQLHADAIEQAKSECGKRAPCVLWKMQSCRQWLLSLPGGVTYHNDDAIAACLNRLQAIAQEAE